MHFLIECSAVQRSSDRLVDSRGTKLNDTLTINSLGLCLLSGYFHSLPFVRKLLVTIASHDMNQKIFSVLFWVASAMARGGGVVVVSVDDVSVMKLVTLE
jgi:hypothetical protein